MTDSNNTPSACVVGVCSSRTFTSGSITFIMNTTFVLNLNLETMLHKGSIMKCKNAKQMIITIKTYQNILRMFLLISGINSVFHIIRVKF